MSKRWLRIPVKFATILRTNLWCIDPITQEELTPWIRLALFFEETATDSGLFSFFSVDPRSMLTKGLKIDASSTFEEIAREIIKKLRDINVNWDTGKVRKRLQFTNAVHAECMETNYGQPDLWKYEGFKNLQVETETGALETLAEVVKKDSCIGFRRDGLHRFFDTESTLKKLHPVAKDVAMLVQGGRSVCFDFIESGNFGVRCGLLGWNTRASNIGTVLGAIFSNDRDLYENSNTLIFTDQQGRPCTYYGWPLSSDELSQVSFLHALISILAKPKAFDSQIEAANNDVLRCFEELGVRYDAGIHFALVKLFAAYILFTFDEFSTVVSALKQDGLRVALTQVDIIRNG